MLEKKKDAVERSGVCRSGVYWSGGVQHRKWREVDCKKGRERETERRRDDGFTTI
jgi:hypothetical protein